MDRLSEEIKQNYNKFNNIDIRSVSRSYLCLIIQDLLDFCAKRIPFSFPLPSSPSLAFAEDDAEGSDGAESQLQTAVKTHAVLE